MRGVAVRPRQRGRLALRGRSHRRERTRLARPCVLISGGGRQTVLRRVSAVTSAEISVFCCRDPRTRVPTPVGAREGGLCQVSAVRLRSASSRSAIQSFNSD